MLIKKQNISAFAIAIITFLTPYMVCSMHKKNPNEKIQQKTECPHINCMFKNTSNNDRGNTEQNPTQNSNNNYDRFLMEPPKKITRLK